VLKPDQKYRNFWLADRFFLNKALLYLKIWSPPVEKGEGGDFREGMKGLSDWKIDDGGLSEWRRRHSLYADNRW